jgi:hypothetical protein
MTAPYPSSAHLEVEEVVGYLEGRLDGPTLRRVQAHLADCAECASEMVEVSRLRRSPRPVTRWVATAAATAAVLAATVVASRAPHHQPAASDSTPIRGAEAATVAIVRPAEGAEVTGSPDFVWRSVPGATSYRIAVSRADGDSVWAESGRDTTARPPVSVSYGAAGLYYWYVDVLLADGRSMAGEAHEFRWRP